MTATCSTCGSPLVPDARFCAQCGTPVPASPAAPPAGPGAFERPRESQWYAEDQTEQASSPGEYDDYYPEDVPSNHGSPWPEPEAQRSRARLITGAVLLGFVIVVGLLYFLLLRPAGSRSEPLVGAKTPTTTVTVAQSAATVSSPPTTTATTAPPAYPTVVLPVGATLCPTLGTDASLHVAAGNAQTSCEFAVAVREAYVPAAAPGAPVSIQAASPRTGKTYAMTCTGSQPVQCTGGNNALVIIFGGTPQLP